MLDGEDALHRHDVCASGQTLLYNMYRGRDRETVGNFSAHGGSRYCCICLNIFNQSMSKLGSCLAFYWAAVDKSVSCSRERRCYRGSRIAGVAKLVDAPDLGSGAARRGGSSPSTRTTKI